MNQIKKPSRNLLRLIESRATRFFELSSYISSYGFGIQINICDSDDGVLVTADLLENTNKRFNPESRKIIREAIVAYLTGKFDHNISDLILIADDKSRALFPYSEIACILAVFFLRKRSALGAPTGCSHQCFSRYVACASGFMNSSHALRGELLEIRENTNPDTRLAQFFDNLIWQKPPVNICVNEILYAFGHLCMLPMQWFYVNHIFSDSGLPDSILKRQSYMILKNYFLQDPCARVPSKALSFVVNHFMKVACASYASSSEKLSSLQRVFAGTDNSTPVTGGRSTFMKETIIIMSSLVLGLIIVQINL